MTVFEELAVVGKAFASAKRLKISELLAPGPNSVEPICPRYGAGPEYRLGASADPAASWLVDRRKEATVPSVNWPLTISASYSRGPE